MGPDVIQIGARPIFQVPEYSDLPPLPGQRERPSGTGLALLFEKLIDIAGCNVLPAPVCSPDTPSILGAFETLKAAASQFDVHPGVGLANHFWTHGAAFHRGDVRAQLLATARSEQPVQGFLALYATEIRSPLLYNPGMRPFRVRTEIFALPDVSGPFLALIVCELLPDGRVEAVSGHALPIYQPHRFLAVRSDLDRDVLRSLEHLQIALDAHGVGCSIQRIAHHAHMPMTQLALTVSGLDGTDRRIRLVIDPTEQKRAGALLQADFCVTPENWEDGRFIAWLTRVVSR